jgi:hypothetical protein
MKTWSLYRKCRTEVEQTQVQVDRVVTGFEFVVDSDKKRTLVVSDANTNMSSTKAKSSHRPLCYPYVVDALLSRSDRVARTVPSALLRVAIA